MKWINALGLILQFLAFWFAAPELLGATTMGRLEKGLTKFFSRLPLVLILTLIGFYVAFYVVGALFKGIKAGNEGIEKAEIMQFYIELGIASTLYFLLIAFYKKINNWLYHKMAVPLILRLIHENETRRIALFIGAVLFTLGFLMQLGVVLLT
ncbi:MAG: hypothetical protein EP332_11130 [Bacteroidetes bacterium]|nr:MAG: hypothetical protein EP332_11130 [Bacteroidota bacterium]